ncbi:MAG: DEAD/DEAH box helicase [Pseudomonadota bacterium]
MTDLLKTYRALSEDDRKLVLLSAAYGEPVMQTHFKNLLMELGWRNEKGRVLYQYFDGTARSRLVRAGVWVEENGLFRCHADLVVPLCREAQEEGFLVPVIAAIQKKLPYRQKEWPSEEADRRLHRDLRFAALQNDESVVFRILGYSQPDFISVNLTFARDLISAYGNALDQASNQLQFLALSPILTHGERTLEDERIRYDRFEAVFGAIPESHRNVLYSLAARRLFRGHFAAAEAILPHEAKEYYADALRTVFFFLRGEDAAALPTLEQALRESKKASGKRTLHFSGLPGVLHLLLLMREDSPQARKLLEQQLVAIHKPIQPDSDYDPIFLLIEKTWQVLQGALSFDPRDSYFVFKSHHNPWLVLFQGLCLHWLGAAPEGTHRQCLRDFQRQAAQGGYLWYAREAALLLQAWGDKGDYRADIAALNCKPLTDLRRPEADWERTLRVLREIATPVLASGSGKPVVESELRMAWNIVIFDKTGQAHLEPREQKRRKSGWGRGRPVALKRLRDELASFEHLTAEDRSICASIRGEQVGWGWGGSKTEYQLDPLTSLRAAVGNPRLFLAGQPVTLIQDHPRLLVTREKNNIRILLHPPVDENQEYRLIQEGNRLRFFEFTPQHHRVGALLSAKGLLVPKEAETRVLETIAAIAPLITVHSEIGGDAGGDVEKVTADARLYLQLQPLGEGLRITCLVKPLGDQGPQASPGEGAASIFSEIGGKRLHARRDLKAERVATARLFAICPALDPEAWDWPLDDPLIALETLENLRSLGDDLVLEWPQGKAVRLARHEGLKAFQVRVGGQQDWFAVSGDLTLDDGRVLDMARLIELLGLSAGRFVRIGEDEYLGLSQELYRRLQAIRAVQDRGRVHSLATGLLDEALEGLDVKTDKAWKAQKQRLAEASNLTPELPSTLQAELREYQLEGFKWLARLAHWGAGACLADDMGLGKTVQALALLLTRAAGGPALVLAPTSVCANWINEAARFAPTLNTQTFGSGDRAAQLAALGPFDLLVCSYGLLQSEAEALAGVSWHTLIADEAQAFKNTQTKRSKAVMDLQGAFRMITTGTPIENHLGELWNLFRFINPGLLGSLEHFNNRFANPIEQRQDKDARHQLKRLIRPFILRRLKRDVLAELPERTEITIHVELSNEERVFYEALRRTALERIANAAGPGGGDPRFQILAEIMRLRRACCNPKLVIPESPVGSAKLQAFTEIVEELRDNHHKALVFSQFVGHLALIREWLDGQRIAYQYLDGSTPTKKRQEAVNAFQSGQGDLFLISLKAGGAGLNLTAADYVIHLDPWWNPAVEDQASDRAHRIGQQRPVTIYRLVARDTIEDRIIDLHRHKRDLADSLLEGAEISARLGVEEMMALLREV